MGGGDLNLKKSWHPSTLRNMEKVWKAEQKNEAEKKKIELLQRELAEERDREEMRHIAEGSGVIQKREERLDWMYQGPSAMVEKDDYLLGRRIDKTFELMQEKEIEKENPKANEKFLGDLIRQPSAASGVAVDMTNKLRLDPLFQIKKQEYENKKSILNNPIRKKQLQEMLKLTIEESKVKKHSSHKSNKKHKKHYRTSSSERDHDEKKYKHHREPKPRNQSPVAKSYHKRSRSRSPLEEKYHRRRRSGSSSPQYKRHHKDSQESYHKRSRSRSPLEKKYHRQRRSGSSSPQYKRHHKDSQESYHKRSRSRSPLEEKYHRQRRSGSSSPQYKRHHKDSQDENAPKFGLVLSENYEPRQRHDAMNEYKSPFKKRQEREPTPKRKQKRSAEEMARLRDEMMNEGKKREEDRVKDIKRYKEEDEKEEKRNVKTTEKPNFVKPLLQKAYETGTVADRIKQNKFRLQRSHNSIDSNFIKRN